ncbi:hypothetical protein C8F01DRAFT_1120809 [Mycena amicta]|nr:hypothetical protein C8F01DRAFT_1120809 [Mycena amicta]
MSVADRSSHGLGAVAHLNPVSDYVADAALPPRTTAFISGASDMDVNDANFTNVYGNHTTNFNFNAGTALPPQPFPTPTRPVDAPLTATLNELDMSGSAVQTQGGFYFQALMHQGRGCPIFKPGPQPRLPDEYRKTGISIGDVGRLTPEGEFDFLFNIYRPREHAIHVHGVPENFEPLQRGVRSDSEAEYDPHEIDVTDYPAGDYVSTPSVKETGGPINMSFPGGSFSFKCSGANGVVLALPYGAHAEKHANTDVLRRYAAKHAQSWYAFANGQRGRGLRNGSLCLVYGCEKTPSWGMAQFRHTAANESFPLGFVPTAEDPTNIAGYKYRWQRGTPARGKEFNPESEVLNQTTFIHTLTISLGQSLRQYLFGPKVDVFDFLDFQGSGPSQGAAFNGTGSQSFLSRFSGFLPGNTPTRGRQASRGAPDSDSNVEVTDATSLPDIINPSQIINAFILQKIPSAEVVITQDEDWQDILRTDGSENPVLSEWDLIKQVSKHFTIVQEDALVYLQRAVPRISKPHSEASPSNTMWPVEEQSSIRGVDDPYFKFTEVKPTIHGVDDTYFAAADTESDLLDPLATSLQSFSFDNFAPMIAARANKLPLVEAFDKVQIADYHADELPFPPSPQDLLSPQPQTVGPSSVSARAQGTTVVHGDVHQPYFYPSTMSTSPSRFSRNAGKMQPGVASSSAESSTPFGQITWASKISQSTHDVSNNIAGREEGSEAGRNTARSRRKDPTKSDEYICKLCGADFATKHNLNCLPFVLD